MEDYTNVDYLCDTISELLNELENGEDDVDSDLDSDENPDGQSDPPPYRPEPAPVEVDLFLDATDYSDNESFKTLEEAGEIFGSSEKVGGEERQLQELYDLQVKYLDGYDADDKRNRDVTEEKTEKGKTDENPKLNRSLDPSEKGTDRAIESTKGRKKRKANKQQKDDRDRTKPETPKSSSRQIANELASKSDIDLLAADRRLRITGGNESTPKHPGVLVNVRKPARTNVQIRPDQLGENKNLIIKFNIPKDALRSMHDGGRSSGPDGLGYGGQLEIPIAIGNRLKIVLRIKSESGTVVRGKSDTSQLQIEDKNHGVHHKGGSSTELKDVEAPKPYSTSYDNKLMVKEEERKQGNMFEIEDTHFPELTFPEANSSLNAQRSEGADVKRSTNESMTRKCCKHCRCQVISKESRSSNKLYKSTSLLAIRPTSQSNYIHDDRTSETNNRAITEIPYEIYEYVVKEVEMIELKPNRIRKIPEKRKYLEYKNAYDVHDLIIERPQTKRIQLTIKITSPLRRVFDYFTKKSDLSRNHSLGFNNEVGNKTGFRQSLNIPKCLSCFESVGTMSDDSSENLNYEQGPFHLHRNKSKNIFLSSNNAEKKYCECLNCVCSLNCQIPSNHLFPRLCSSFFPCANARVKIKLLNRKPMPPIKDDTGRAVLILDSFGNPIYTEQQDIGREHDESAPERDCDENKGK